LHIGNYLLSVVVSLSDWLTPQLDFPDELKRNNLSVAVFLAGLFVGLGMVVGNAVK
jgi:uncharacterized membrane protein YjfL (UPF0719 family)